VGSPYIDIDIDIDIAICICMYAYMHMHIHIHIHTYTLQIYVCVNPIYICVYVYIGLIPKVPCSPVIRQAHRATVRPNSSTGEDSPTYIHFDSGVTPSRPQVAMHIYVIDR